MNRELIKDSVSKLMAECLDKLIREIKSEEELPFPKSDPFFWRTSNRKEMETYTERIAMYGDEFYMTLSIECPLPASVFLWCRVLRQSNGMEEIAVALETTELTEMTKKLETDELRQQIEDYFVMLIEKTAYRNDMSAEKFSAVVEENKDLIREISSSAYQLNGHNLMYQPHAFGLHLGMVLEYVLKYGYLVCPDERDIIPLIFGACYYNSIRDTWMDFYDVQRAAESFMPKSRAEIASHIAYALTPEKGLSINEMESDRYFENIRTTPYAPFVRLAVRLANMDYDRIYEKKRRFNMNGWAKAMHVSLPQLIEKIRTSSNDIRLLLPQCMINDFYMNQHKKKKKDDNEEERKEDNK